MATPGAGSPGVSGTGNGWTLWFGMDGNMMMLPLVGNGAEEGTSEAESTPASTPTSSPIPTSTSATLTSQTVPTSHTSHTSSSTPSSTPSPTTSATLSAAAVIPKGAIITIIIVGACVALAVAVWVLTRFWRARRRRSHELEDGESYYPFGSEFGFFRSRPGTPSSPSLKYGQSVKGDAEIQIPEPAQTSSKELSEKVAGTPMLAKRLSDGPYPTTLRLPSDFAGDDPFPAPPPKTKLTVANFTSRDMSPASTIVPSDCGSPLSAEMLKTAPRSPWAGSVDAFRSPALVISSPTTASVKSLPMPTSASPPTGDSWTSFRATVSSAISSFSSQFARPAQVHMPDSFTRPMQRSQSLLSTSSDGSVGSIRRARALDRAQMARVISIDREALRKASVQSLKEEQRVHSGSGLPSPHVPSPEPYISTPNPFEDGMERFGSPRAEGLVRTSSQRERLGPRRMPTTSSTYSSRSSIC